MGRLRKVRSDSGRLVPFRQSRISESILEAVRACGTGDGVLADELAGVVTLFLEKRFDDGNPPRLIEIRDMVYKVLYETGHVRIANTFQRLGARGAEVAERAVRGDEGGESLPRLDVVRGSVGIPEPWRRERLIRSLLDETRISEQEADEIAVEVERKIARTGLRRLSTSLIREFVDVEMAGRGHEKQLARYRLLGVSKQEVERWIYPSQTASEGDPEELCARAVLSGYALEELHSPAVAKAHLDGRIHIQGLGNPLRVEELTIDATGPLFSADGGAEDFLLELITLLQAVKPLVRRRVVIAHLAEALDGVAARRATRKRAFGKIVQRLLDHLTRVDVFGRPVFPPLCLDVSLEGADFADRERAGATLSSALLDELERRPGLGGRLGIVFSLRANEPFDWPESEVLGKLLTAARRHRGLGLRLVRGDEALDATGRPLDRDRLQLDVGACALNLPYALALADVRDESEITAALDGPLRLAIEAMFEKYWFLRKSAPETLRGLVARLPGGESTRIDGTGQGAQLLLWGLPHALRFLEGRGVITADQGPEILARIFSYVEYLAGEEHENIRLEMTLGGVAERKVRHRFLKANQALAMQLALPELTLVQAESLQGLPTLPLVTPLTDPRNAPVLEGGFLARFGRGLPLPARGEDEIANGLWLRQLFEKTRLAYLELEERAEIFEVQESLFDA
ncbi:MAG: hypothetical protein H6807_12385 [Planctomycetes bacterium]|nr:hypothetical protein [Planctomycetota bacterium]